MTIDAIMRMAPVIPVLVIEDGLDPVALAETLVEAGLPVIEVTLRTPGALEAIRAMASIPGAVVGAGTVRNEAQLAQSLDGGAQFIVSPGLTNPLALAARDTGVPFLPGIATASDLLRGLDLGLTHFKFFPAEAMGGLATLKALAGPFPDARFCPTGGISEASGSDWLAHPSVLCVGGSWIVPNGETDLAAISKRARAAAGLRK